MPLHRRVTKIKGFSNLRFKTTYQVVNVERLAALYPDGGDVTPDDLAAKGAVRPGELVKVLGSGEAGPGPRLTPPRFPPSAREKTPPLPPPAPPPLPHRPVPPSATPP